ncbi:hypothetical protein BpHYR1_033314 [Brachionus plicatilis]|uniref:Uncharacterized protein n=1 Tax=Brachionus plicatilis TaxID=10195 RepID=A0A3M7SJQ7_BRAPC|nr:hypothetical protein BpHYR1_033314 [Brachionus plicatilis]
MQIFERFRPVFLIHSGVFYLGLWMLIDKYGMDVVAKSAGGLGFLVMGAVAISYLSHEVEANEAKLEDEKVMTVFKLLTSGEKPDNCSKDGSDLCIYCCNFRDFRIFGKNVYRCYDKSEYGVHFQDVEPTAPSPDAENEDPGNVDVADEL